MQEESHNLDYNTFKDVCRKHNIRMTPQRIAIFQCLNKLSDHPSAESVYHKLHDLYPNISYDTVNRTLIKFAEIGIIDITEGIGTPRRFDPKTEQHHHFHCVECGKIFDFNFDCYDNLELPEELATQHEIIQKRVILRGLCSTCKK